jgi:predicted nucleic-acid-binding protein
VKGVDTNILLRLLLADDAEQLARAENLLSAELPRQPLFINRIVLCEFAWTLERTYKYRREQIADAIDQFLKTLAFEVDDYDAASFALYLYRTSRADFADCLIGVSNGFLGCGRTATFDRRAAELDEFELI